ncbi:hypothetical protein K469DRAFT_707523, partial [Zopfia rhizophila CBS 207.26]
AELTTEIVKALPHRLIEIKIEAECIVVVLPSFIKNSIEFISSGRNLIPEGRFEARER